jgi:hypothetical protein
MRRHRTTARGISLSALLLAASLAGTAATHASATKVPPLIFPVVGAASFVDDFGDPRGQGRHEANDIMAAKRAPAVAAEAGVVKFWTTSARAGCMLYLEGDSGTEYLYVHLNNDLTAANDNRGKCVPGVAFWRGLTSGDRVEAGQPIGFVGDSGDADGIAAHLHFEVHPGAGAAVSPYRHLLRARKLLFAVQPGRPFTAALRGTVVESVAGTLTLKVDQARSWPGGVRVQNVNREIELMVPPETQLFDALGTLLAAANVATLKPGQTTVAWTQKQAASLEAALGEPSTLVTEKLVLTR